jgi:hypothetical protein
MMKHYCSLTRDLVTNYKQNFFLYSPSLICTGVMLLIHTYISIVKAKKIVLWKGVKKAYIKLWQLIHINLNPNVLHMLSLTILCICKTSTIFILKVIPIKSNAMRMPPCHRPCPDLVIWFHFDKMQHVIKWRRWRRTQLRNILFNNSILYSCNNPFFSQTILIPILNETKMFG